ncbi:CsiV family protein [Hahella sp. CCB-MM4]|uniref:CsiV family protein n=1 Tax=Hahella sp. (strain CCB-MM4) TaxID=1926491 RepID=UPI00143D26B6|nr:CsiV family protein [Hahella sp. CCB-MM4]
MRNLIYKANDLMKPTNIFAALTLTALFLHGAVSRADTTDETKRFQVDVIIFKNLSPETEETFDHPPVMQDDTAPLSLVSFNPLTENQTQLLPESAYILKEEERKLARSRNFSVISHYSWMISLRESQSLTYQIPSQIDADNETELQGQINIALRRYLHATPNITITRWATPEPTFLDNLFGELQTPTTMGDMDGLNAGNSAQAASSPAYSPIAPELPTNPLKAKGLEPREYYNIHQPRRMRSGEVHYFDHPMFGLLIKMIPVAMEDATTSAEPLPDTDTTPEATTAQ